MTILINNEDSDSSRIEKALLIAFQYGQNDSGQHLQWTIDQMVRALTGDGYEAWVEEYEGDPEDYENHYEWDAGIPG